MAAADPGTDAARLEVLRARGELLDEVARLEASARAAADIKARVRRSPAKAAAVAGGVGFVALGGPRRVLRGLRRVVRGPAPAYPPSMLPDEIERVVRSLGDDGDKVRGTLEREFANYVSEKKRADRRFWRQTLALGVVAPTANAVLRVATRRLLQPDPETYGRWMNIVASRAGRAAGGPSGAGGETGAAAPSRPEDATD